MALQNLTDEQLLAQALAGDEDAFTVLYRRRQGPVFRFALHMSGSTQIAEEVTQDVFVFLLQRRDTLHRISMSALPIAGLLPPFQVLTPQSSYFGAQLIDFCQKPRNERRQIRAGGCCFQR